MNPTELREEAESVRWVYSEAGDSRPKAAEALCELADIIDACGRRGMVTRAPSRWSATWALGPADENVYYTGRTLAEAARKFLKADQDDLRCRPLSPDGNT